MQNICGCGATAGYPHRPTCPYPLYRGTEADWAEWDLARSRLEHEYSVRDKIESPYFGGGGDWRSDYRYDQRQRV